MAVNELVRTPDTGRNVTVLNSLGLSEYDVSHTVAECYCNSDKERGWRFKVHLEYSDTEIPLNLHLRFKKRIG